ncbi:hypothetical protein [Tropicibacter sp. Alg240-R139]|uniref:hypothetical protein n=1 Tax=Tropicibacter sp. Alg240-R139 TaxID=2305991 RepID=UPI0013DEA15F|nr:hypothetical protein [Tropicibacter sp. Alg240-R139]
MSTAISYVSLRLSLVLPSAAVGVFLSVPESWEKTKAHSKALWDVALCIGVLTLTPNFLLLTSLARILGGFAYVVVAQWVLLMLSVSILTTMYGYIVQGRELR